VFVQDFVSGLACCVNKPHHNSSLSRLVVVHTTDSTWYKVLHYVCHGYLFHTAQEKTHQYFIVCPQLYMNITNKYRLIHGHFHIGLVIIPRPPILAREMITRPIWKCPCIKLFITYFRHLEKRHPYWPETKSRPILALANMGLDIEMIL
jgi:hypothetical protein